MWTILLAISALAAEPVTELAGDWVVDRWTIEEGLPVDHIADVALDPDGRVWVATLGGLVRLDGTTVEVLGQREAERRLPARFVGVVSLGEGRVAALSETGRLFDVQEHHIRELDGAALGGRLMGIGSAGGVVWAVGKRGLGRLRDGAIVRVAPPGRAGQGEPLRMEAAGDTVVLISQDRFLAQYRVVDSALELVEETRLDGPDDLPGMLTPAWGGWEADGTTLRWRGEAVLQSDVLLRIQALDASGNVWVASRGRGLLHTRVPVVETWMEGPTGPLGNIHAVASRRPRDGSSTERYVAHERGLLWVKGASRVLVVDPGGQPLPRVHTAVGGGDEVLVGMDGRNCLARGAVCVDLPKGLGAVYGGMRHSDGSWWTSGQVGIAVVRDQKISWRWRTSEPVVGRALLELDDGSVLATTRGAGLLHLRQDGEVHARSTDAGLPNEALRYLARAPDGHVWVTAGGGGLCRLGELAGHTLAEVAVDCLGTREGLPDGFVHAVNWDDFGRMWLSTNRGLVLLNPEDVDAVLAGERAQVSPFLLDTSDGMASAEGNGVYQSPVSTGDDGTLAYATQRGVAVLHPDRVDVDPDVPAYLTSVKVDGREHPIEDGLVLEADFQQLELTWSAVDFVRPKKLRFRYRVGDSRWSLPTEARTHVWQTLPPGDQTVQVQAGLAGTWGPPATLRVHRTPRWSEHPAYDWVLVLLAMLGTAGALGARVVHAQRQRAQLEAVVRERTAALSERTAELADRNALLEVQGDLLEKQADELHRRDEERVRFVANISHELRTPLTLVQAPLEEMDATALSPVDATHLDRARRSARRLGELVGQLIDVARLDAGGVALKVRRADLGAFCRRVADRFGSASQQRGQCLDVRVDDLVAWFDPDHMDKIVSNLLGNAMKFTPQAGTIRLTLKQQGEGDDSVAVLTVDDSGPGVPDDEKGRIFERFYQSSSEDTREHEGTGMGLTLAHELVALHGGDVVVEDSPLGGARFVVRVPRGTSHLSPEEILLGEAADEVPTEPTEGHDHWPVLLVVEDHPDMRAFLVQSLSTSFRIRAARNGLEALAMMATERPDVVLSDVMMPELDGVSLCTRMKAAPDLAAIPVLLLSAKTSGADRERGLEVADDYMTKPFRVAELRLRLHRLVGRAREADAPPGTPEAPRTPEAPETPEAPARPAAEVRFMEKLEALVAARMADCDFRAKDLATELGMGPRQLHRRVGDVWGLSPSALLRERRLLAAREMLRRGEFETVAEIAGAVGMAPSYFSRAYRQWAGRPPSADLPR